MPEKQRILLIEDYKDLRDNTQLFLNECGYECFAAADGAEGLAQAENLIPDLILCDISLPLLNGYEIYQALQKNSQTQNIPFVFVTAKADKEDIKTGLSLGVDDYITKPFSFDHLLQTIQIRLGKQQAMVQQQEVKFKGLVENSLTGVFIHSKTGFEYINAKCAEILGINAWEANNYKWYDFISENDLKPISQIFMDALKHEGKKIHLSFSCTSKNGNTIHIELFGTSFMEKNQMMIMGNMLDVTEQINTFKDLQEAKSIAEKASSVKTVFLANMGHELRTPLNAILGFSNILKDTPLNTEQKELFNYITDAADDLLVMVNNLLDVANLETQEISLKKQNFPLKESILKSIQYLAGKAHVKNLSFSYYIAPNVPEMAASDKFRLQQLIQHIGGNAVKFTNQGFVKIHAEVLEDNVNSFLLQLKFTDSGIGIEKENLCQIFDVFSQVDSSFSRNFGGIGLGLTLSSKIVQAMNGKIFIESTINQGTTFTCNVWLGKV